MKILKITLTPLLNYNSMSSHGGAYAAQRTETRESNEITAERREGFVDFHLDGTVLSYRVGEILKYEITEKKE